MASRKNLTEARIDGVNASPPSGSCSGTCGGGSRPAVAAWYQPSAATPALRTKMLTKVQKYVNYVGTLPTSGSAGQLLV